jgi:hypothetical protein
MGKKARQRPPVWKHVDGETVDKVSDALAPSCPRLFMVDGSLYESMEMQSGIDAVALTKWSKPLLEDLVGLDPRGGYFSQSDVQEGLTKQGNLDLNKLHITKLATDRKMSVGGFFTRAHGSWKNYLVTWMSESHR